MSPDDNHRRDRCHPLLEEPSGTQQAGKRPTPACSGNKAGAGYSTSEPKRGYSNCGRPEPLRNGPDANPTGPNNPHSYALAETSVRHFTAAHHTNTAAHHLPISPLNQGRVTGHRDRLRPPIHTLVRADPRMHDHSMAHSRGCVEQRNECYPEENNHGTNGDTSNS